MKDLEPNASVATRHTECNFRWLLYFDSIPVPNLEPGVLISTELFEDEVPPEEQS